MDLHDYKDVAENYDLYVDILTGKTGLNNSDCVNFHMELAGKYGKDGIADIGCGTGLVMIPLLREGYRVYGVDISQEMINVTRLKLEEIFDGEKAYDLICSSMVDFILENRVSLIIIPRSGFLHLLTSEEQIGALKTMNRNLLPGGILSLNTYYPSYEFIAQNGKDKLNEPFFREAFKNTRGSREEIYNLTQYDYETQIMEGKWIFKEFDSDGHQMGERERPLKMRWTFRSEMELLFTLCGFEVVESYGGYDKSKATYPSNIVWVVRKVSEV